MSLEGLVVPKKQRSIKNMKDKDILKEYMSNTKEK